MKNSSILTIILNYRTPEMTLKSAASALEEMRELGGEILIIDNDSQDESFELISTAIIANGWDDGGMVRVLPSPPTG